MSGPHAARIVLLCLEAALVALALVGLFRMRRWLGLGPLFAVLGALQPIQTLLALTLYVEVAPGLSVSPGSVVLFPADVFAILLLYVREATSDARKLIYALVSANVVMAVLLWLLGLHLDAGGAPLADGVPRAFFLQNPRMVAVGTLALYLDFLLVVLAYEVFGRLLRGWVFARVLATMALVLGFDSFFFATGAFAGTPEYLPVLVSGLFGKGLAALVYSAILVGYLRHFEGEAFLVPRQQVSIGDVFRVLTFQKDYEGGRERAARDLLTGLYNDVFFADLLPREVERSRRFSVPTSVLLLDLDGFRGFRKEFGRQEADRMLTAVGVTLGEAVRATDIACRLEEDAFAVILPDAGRAVVRRIADGIRYRLTEVARSADPPLPGGGLTAVLACGTIPDDTDSPGALVRLVQARLRAGKRSGGDCVVAAPEPGEPRFGAS